MIGLRSQFGTPLIVAMVVAATALLVGIGMARREHARGRPWLPALAKALAIGAIVATVVSTAWPRQFGIQTDGDLVLTPGRGGLGDWEVLYRDPLSLAAIELVANVLLYAAVGFTAFFAWFRQRRLVLPACLALSLLVETAQYLVLGRVATLDDVVLNLSGAAIGYLAASALLRTGAIDERVLAADVFSAGRTPDGTT